MEYVSSVSSEMNRRLHATKELAESAEEGSVFFLEVTYKPIISLFITTGSISRDNPQKRSVHLRFVNEPEHYSELIDFRVMHVNILGFKIYT